MSGDVGPGDALGPLLGNMAAFIRTEDGRAALSRTGDAWNPPLREPAAREAEILEKVKLLVEAGVDLNVVDAEGLTALDGAQVLGYDSVARLLVEAGAQEGDELRD